MKLCVLANLYGSKTLDETLGRLKSLGVEIDTLTPQMIEYLNSWTVGTN